MGSIAGLRIREMQLSQMAKEYSFADYEISFTGVTNDQKVVEALYRLAINPLTALYSIDNEFMCLYCGSPNPLKHRHCSQCGSPRGFIIGGDNG